MNRPAKLLRRLSGMVWGTRSGIGQESRKTMERLEREGDARGCA